jgi:N4-gp56 family major capsid protein
MAFNNFATSDPLAKKAWDEELFRDVNKESFFAPLESTSGDNIVHVKTQLEKGRGDKITFPLRMRLTGEGVGEGQQLEGNEEALSLYNFDMSLSEYRHATKVERGISDLRVAFSITDEARQAIKDWGVEKIDKLKFDALFGGTPSKVFYRLAADGTTVANASEATAKAGINSTNSRLTADFLRELKTWARTNRAGGQVPLRPIKISGKDHYLFLCHDDALTDLKKDSKYESYVREAADRGKENPLFTGATAIIDGVVIRSHENCPVALDGGGASVPWTQAAFMGAQSLLWAWGKRPETIMDEKDYKKFLGYGIEFICKAARPVFNSKDYGSMRVYLARGNYSGI